jgi:hypothetical protein
MAWAASVLLITLAAAGRSAYAQAALDDDESSKPVASQSATADEPRVGVAIGLRQTWVPRSIIELFVDKAPGGSSTMGYRFELFRRKGDFEVQLGFEYESIEVQPGIWVQKGQDPTNGGADHVFFNNFGWFSIEATFLNHTTINKYVALRYGGGAGLGILKGTVNRTDSICNSPDPAQANDNSCHDMPNPNQNTPYNMPPVFPVINAIIGVQLRPTDNILINVEGGIRTIPFFGLDVGFLF